MKERASFGKGHGGAVAANVAWEPGWNGSVPTGPGVVDVEVAPR